LGNLKELLDWEMRRFVKIRLLFFTLFFNFIYFIAGFGFAEIAIRSIDTSNQTVGILFDSELTKMELWAGFSITKMSQMNDYLTEQKDSMSKMGYSHDASINKFYGAIEGGADLDFALTRNLQMGPRLGFMYLIPAQISGTYTSVSPYYGPLKYSWKRNFNGYVLPISVGIKYLSFPNTWFNVAVGINAGVAIAMLNENSVYKSDDPFVVAHPVTPFDYTIQSLGGGYFINCSTAMNFVLGNNFGMNLRLGYRICEVSPLIITRGKDNTPNNGEVFSGETVENSHGTPVLLDLGGVSASFGFLFGF
jgi:hypothetical protein